ncbi:MAG: RecX family transcriptional regulator [Saccharofermentans sp.]|nr:RecX family transcriptional regulator [Saccharofermentans sp.]
MSDIDSAVNCAIKHIGIATYSSGKIFEYLARKGFDEDICNKAVAHLVSTGYIDDIKASRKVLFNRSGKKQESRNYIYNRLIAAGIAPDCADEVLSTLDSDEVTCLAMIKANYDSKESVSYEDCIKLAIRRGYTLEVARRSYDQWD